MPSETRSPRLAVLIDADNASAKIADGLFEEIAKIGEASVRRIYGDFSSTRSKAWADTLSKHAIIPQQQFAYTTGKNASDITLVIDAMDLLHSGRFDGFCLVSSDSDFTRLAARIREQGVDVFGFGEQKTPESFRQACRRFVYTENLLPAASGESTKTRCREEASRRAEGSRSDPAQGGRAGRGAVGVRRRLGGSWLGRKKPRQPGSGFRLPHIRLSQADRSRKGYRRIRRRPCRRQGAAHQTEERHRSKRRSGRRR